MNSEKNTGQLVWGIALAFMGIAMIAMIPQKFAEIEKVSQSSILYFGRFCLYLFGFILVGGGIKKIVTHIRLVGDNNSEESK